MKSEGSAPADGAAGMESRMNAGRSSSYRPPPQQRAPMENLKVPAGHLSRSGPAEPAPAAPAQVVNG